MKHLQSVDFTHVQITGDFWKERIETVLNRTIPSQYKKLYDLGYIDFLTIKETPPELVFPRNADGFTCQVFWDSDIGKWIEAASYALQHQRDADIEQKIDAIIDQLEIAQMPDGYLNSWYLNMEPENRWTNMRDNHELYNAGHLLEGAIAYYQATGKEQFLTIMERYLAHIAHLFGKKEGQLRGYPGHQEIELALMKLYKVKQNPKILELALYFINERGQQPHYFDLEAQQRQDAKPYGQGTHEYSQSHRPVREQTKVVGHAVRAMYMYAAMADLAAETQDSSLKSTCQTLWDDVIHTRMYITGGFGSSKQNEGFTEDYDLPNETAYAETCASVAMILWSHRMFHMDPNSRYMDIVERCLYNGALVGLSLSGDQYFYDNPLESHGQHHRWDWHFCPCCTMNASRLIASIANYFYSTAADHIYVHLYGGSCVQLTLETTKVTIEETSNYPWQGDIALKVTPETEHVFTIALRLPDWCDHPQIAVNGHDLPLQPIINNGYAYITRRWKKDDCIQLRLSMQAKRMYPHPRIAADQNKVALQRGPFIYCLEQLDQQDDIALMSLPDHAPLEDSHTKDIQKICAVTITGTCNLAQISNIPLYQQTPIAVKPVQFTAIPYYLWCNRGDNSMQVWMNRAIA